MRARVWRLVVTAAFYLEGTIAAVRSAPALVHANDYNTMWIAVAAKLLRGSRIVYDCHELWPDRNGRPEWRPWLIACEALFVRIADATVTTSPGYADELARRYRVPAPVLVRNIPVRTAATAALDSEPRAAVHDPPLAIYLGGLMPGRGLEPAIDATVRVPGLRLRLIGPGRPEYRASLIALAARRGVADRVEVLPPVPPAEVSRAAAQADIALMLIQPICLSYALTLPNKLFEYAAAGVPIVSSALPVIGRVVETERIGVTVAVDDPAEIAAGITALLDPGRNREARERAREFARTVSWEAERDRLAGVYARLLSSNGTGSS